MKTSIITIVTMVAFGWSVYGQTKNPTEDQTETFSIDKKNGKIHIDLGNAVIEGYSGNKIIFSSQANSKKTDEKTKGLRSVNGLGLEDNTGLGINVTEHSDAVRVTQMNHTNPPDITILVPRNMIIVFDHQSKYGKKVTLKNIQSEIEISTLENNIYLENITGPAVIKTVNGNVNAVFGPVVKGPVSILSIEGHLDITLPQTIKSDLKMSSKFGELLVAPEFKMEMQKQDHKLRYTNQVSALLNGGGLNIDLRTDHGRIYLRAN